MRLIDANALVESILEERAKIPFMIPAAPYELVKEKPYQHGNSMRGGIRKALRCVANAPTVDAVEVVRCKDCKNWTKGNFRGGNDIEHLEYGGKCALAECARYENDFCSYGKRKDGGGIADNND